MAIPEPAGGDERFVSARRMSEDALLDQALRPRRFAEYIGQSQTKEALQIFIEAARNRGDALDHVLLSGPPGLGKTSLAYVIASELGVQIRTTSGPAVERPGDLAALLTNLGDRDVLFIDEIHRLSRLVEEYLYPAMEDFALDLIVGKGPSARSMRLQLPRFTLIGATTRAGALSSPLRDRFGIPFRLEFYGEGELCEVVRRAAAILGVAVEPEGVAEIARRARGTPRIANRFLKRLRDFAQVKAGGVITAEVARAGLAMLDVDELGLDRVDRRLLLTIIDKYAGGPVGLETLAAAANEPAETIEDVYEPYLMQLGFVDRTPRGRAVTAAGYRHVGRVPPAQPDQQRFRLE